MNNYLYKNIINSLPYALLILDKELKVAECNRGYETLFSKVRKETIGRDLSAIIPHKELRTQVLTVLQNGGTKLVELHIEDDHPKVLRAIVTAINIPERSNGDLCLVSLEDISKRVELESQLVQSEKLAAMGVLASTIAHELGNPLSIMNATLQYIKNVLLDSEDQDLKKAVQRLDIIKPIEIVMDSVGQMHELLRILSGFTGNQVPRFKPTNICQILSNMLTFIYREAEVHNIKISHSFDSNLPECEADQREIKQLFLNLFKNAMEAMPSGGILNVESHLAETKDAIYISISDTGQGLSEYELRMIFKPFYSTKQDGTGLGLSFCRGVVEKHGGEISASSELGRGTIFNILLPILHEEI